MKPGNRIVAEKASGADNLHVLWRPITIATSRMLALLTLIGRNIEQAVLPRACVFCGIRCGQDQDPVCNACHADLPWIDNACSRCASPVATKLPGGVHCAACQLNSPPFEFAIAPLEYAFPVDAAIKAMKFRRKLFYMPAFAYLLAESLRCIPADVDVLLPVPLHWRRQAVRGFNQAAEMCRPIRRKTGLPLISNVTRTRATPYQSGLTAVHRQRNLKTAFAVRGDVKARHVLIVDDVITTGETCRQLAGVLLDAGVEKVSVLAIARA